MVQIPGFPMFSRSFFNFERGIAWPLKSRISMGDFFSSGQAVRETREKENTKSKERKKEKRKGGDERARFAWVLFHRTPPSFRSFLTSSPALLEARCNNGCPLIIERPRHFKEIPGEPITGTPFRSLLKISSLLPPFLPESSNAPFRGCPSVQEEGGRVENKNNERRDRASWKIGFASRDHLPRCSASARIK